MSIVGKDIPRPIICWPATKSLSEIKVIISKFKIPTICNLQLRGNHRKTNNRLIFKVWFPGYGWWCSLQIRCIWYSVEGPSFPIIKLESVLTIHVVLLKGVPHAVYQLLSIPKSTYPLPWLQCITYCGLVPAPFNFEINRSNIQWLCEQAVTSVWWQC